MIHFIARKRQLSSFMVAGMIFTMNSTQSQILHNGRKSIVITSKSAQLVMDVAGGSISSFQFNTQKLNPLTWEVFGSQTNARPMGHFLCLDRWGPPSDSEQKNGMPFHGEASQVDWKTGPIIAINNGPISTEMSAILPLAGLEIKRQISMSESQPFYEVNETITNRNKLGRIYNVVQHATIAPPFLDSDTLIDTNASKGFMQSSPLPNPESIAVNWPEALNNGNAVDMRRLTKDPNPNVVSYVIDGEFGWVTACNKSKALMIGYMWRTEDYPWFNAWRDVKNGEPSARGLEFGTTGLHQPYPILVKKGKIFDRPLFEYIDAQQSITKSYISFLFTIPSDFLGVGKLEMRGGKLIVSERAGGQNRSLVMIVGDILLRHSISPL